MLTDSWLKSVLNKPRESVLEKADRDGLSARVSPKGKIVFQLRFRIEGKQQRLSLGSYPGTSLKEARDRTVNYKEQLFEGNDPRVVRKKERVKNTDVLTVKNAFDLWYQGYCSVHKSSHEEIGRSFEMYTLPIVGSCPVDSLSTNDWMNLLSDIKLKVPSIADRLLGNTKQMLSWLARRELIARNPLENMESKRDLGIIKKPGLRSLTDDEVRMLLVALTDSRLAIKNKLFIRLCLIYGCRNGELRTCERKDLNFQDGTWITPADKHKTGKKTGRPLVRPVIPETERLFRSVMELSPGSKYVFSDQTGANVMSRFGIGSLPYSLMQWLRKNHNYDMVHWSVHDLRKTARTNFSKFTPPHIAEVMLGHKLPGEWSTYDHYYYLEEQADCLRKWCEKLAQLSSESESPGR